jgi:hypothetical protein
MEFLFQFVLRFFGGIWRLCPFHRIKVSGCGTITTHTTDKPRMFLFLYISMLDPPSVSGSITTDLEPLKCTWERSTDARGIEHGDLQQTETYVDDIRSWIPWLVDYVGGNVSTDRTLVI